MRSPCPAYAPPRGVGFPVKAIARGVAPAPCVNYETRGAGTTVDNGLDGAVILDAGAGNFAIHADAFGRRGDDYRIPRYPYLPPRDQTLPFNGRQPNSAMRADGQSVGGSYHLRSGLRRRRGVAQRELLSRARVWNRPRPTPAST